MVSDNRKFTKMSGSSIKISVITVCKNAVGSIEDTIKSVINQSYKNVEHIVIDGASTDGTVNVLDSYKEKLTYILSEPDNGIYDAMNKGINKADGDFLIFLNANDTFYNDNVLENVACFLSLNPEVNLAFGNVNYIDESKVSSEIKVYDDVKNIFYFSKNNICHQSIFYNKKLFEKYGLYSNQYEIYSDWDFNTNCLVKNKEACLYLDLCISNFQLGGKSSDPKCFKLYNEEKNIIVKNYYKNISLFICIDSFLKKILTKTYKKFRKSYLYKYISEHIMCQKRFLLNIKSMKV